ncbi:hypothetical protein Tco_0369837 [Tanacetum coccineum]
MLEDLNIICSPFPLRNASSTFDLGAAVLTGLAVLIDVAALGELYLTALTGTCPDFVNIVVGTNFLLGCG